MLCIVFTRNHQGGFKRAFSQDNKKADILQFAETAVHILESYVPFTIANFLIRVDIMQRNDGSLVVNEFESMEACFFSNRPHLRQHQAEDFIQTFWSNILSSM